jgi:hypothetical protein
MDAGFSGINYWAQVFPSITGTLDVFVARGNTYAISGIGRQMGSRAVARKERHTD